MIGPGRFRYVPFHDRHRKDGKDEHGAEMTVRPDHRFGRGGPGQMLRTHGEQTAGHGVFAVRGGYPPARVMRAGSPARCHAVGMAFTTLGHHAIHIRLRTGIPDQRQEAAGEQHNCQNGGKKVI